MSDWLTIRVLLNGTADTDLDDPPGRIMLAHADHTFADLAESIDVAFARWDLSPSHEFVVDGRVLATNGDDPGSEDSDDVTLGEAGLRVGEVFTYTFDLNEAWHHTCSVDALAVDPSEEYGEEPDTPVPVFGWGTVPDQYWRLAEDEGDDAGWGGPEAWAVVVEALGERPGADVDRDALATVANRLREHSDDRGWPYGALLSAADLGTDDLPDDDETLWVEAASGVVNPSEDLPVSADEEAAWTALEPGDWAALTIELLRAEPGTSADPVAMLELVTQSPEIETQDLSSNEQHTLLRGFDIVSRLLECLGALDEDRRLTLLGRWGLPRAVERGLLAD